MNIICQFLGLIFNLYLVFILSNGKRKSSEEYGKIDNLKVVSKLDKLKLKFFATFSNDSQDPLKLKFLGRIVALLLIFYLILDIQL